MGRRRRWHHKLGWSNDGKNWNHSVNENNIFELVGSVEYGSNIWVAGGKGTNNPLAWSDDGKTWYESEKWK